MDEDNVQQPVNEPAERETAEPETSGPGEQTPVAPKGVATPKEAKGEEAKDLSEIANLQKAIKETRGKNKSFQEKVRQLERKLADYESKQKAGQYPEGELTSIMQHPEVFKLYTENAEYKLRDHVDTVLKGYEDFPKAVATAIKKNPRGWIHSDTQDIESAKVDLEEAIESYYDQYLGEKEADSPIVPPAVPEVKQKGKTAKIAGTNSGVAAKGSDAEKLEKIMEKSPFEWTTEEKQIIERNS